MAWKFSDGTSEAPPGGLAALGELLAVTAVYVVVARLSLALASINPSVTPIWPTAGFALASVLLRGNKITPAIFAGSFLVNAATSDSFFAALAIAVGNTLEAWVTALVINEWARGKNAFERPIDVGKLTLCFFAPGPMISATIGVASLALSGHLAPSEFRAVWTTWWVGDSSGMLVVAPPLVLWGRQWRQGLEAFHSMRTVALYCATVFIGLAAFSPLFEQTPSRTAMAFLAILPLMWAAVRCTPRDTATTALLLSAFAVWGTVMNGGPFFHSNRNESFLLLLAFMIAASAPSLGLSAEVAERRRQEAQLQLLLHEISHRSKNLLQIVQSMASLAARRTSDFKTFFTGFSTRLRALAYTHDLLVKGDWRGAAIRDVMAVQLAPFDDSGRRSIIAEGPNLVLKPKAVEQIGLALHELGTNAVKHGALSDAGGEVRVCWELMCDEAEKIWLLLTWKETGGPAVVRPQTLGFGSLVLTRIVPETLGGTATQEFEPEGLKWVLRIPARNLLTVVSADSVPKAERPAAEKRARDLVDA